MAAVDFSPLLRPAARHDTSTEDLTGALTNQSAFASVPIEHLAAALRRGDLIVLQLERDQLIEIEHTSHFYICEGQVALGLFTQTDVDQRRALQEKREAASDEERSLLPLPPLARTTHKNLARFQPGDIFNAGALENAEGLAFFSLTPITVLQFRNAALAELAAMHEPLAVALGEVLGRSESLFRSITGVKQEIYDFYLRHGLSVSGPSVRVRQLDLCIGCMQCEDACETRHDAKRLTLGGFRLGMLDFVFSCRTCADPRCLSPCEHDAISFDKEHAEVKIDHAKCIGCSLCAESCPYGAIDIVNVSEADEPTYNLNLQKRLSAKGFLEHGPGKARAAPLRRVANKCDHCEGFAEQACVSACPTGALVELDMARLFGDSRTEDVSEPFPIKPFTSSVGVKDAGLARIRDGRFSTWIWGLGIVAWLLASTEIALRYLAPSLSLRYQVLLADGLAPDLAELGVTFLPGSELALFCGYLGTALMVISMAYPLRRRFRLFMRTASNKYWLDLHLMTGTVGPMFILLHTALRLDNWVSIPFGSMLMVVGSGFFGRYLYTLVPAMTYGYDIEELSLRAKLNSITQKVPEAATDAEGFLSSDSRRIQAAQNRVGLFWLLQDEIRQPFVLASRRRRLRQIVPRKTARKIVGLCERIILLERRGVLAPRVRIFLRTWKYIHVPFAILMMGTTILHVVLAIRYSM